MDPLIELMQSANISDMKINVPTKTIFKLYFLKIFIVFFVEPRYLPYSKSHWITSASVNSLSVISLQVGRASKDLCLDAKKKN